MNLLFWGMTISVIGKILLAVGVIMAHNQIAHEHRIDEKVIKSFKKEQTLTAIGVLLIVIGYILEISFFGGFLNFITCEGAECSAQIGAIMR